MECHVGSNGSWTNAWQLMPVCIRNTETVASCADNKYPSSITIYFNASTYIRNNDGVSQSFDLWLVDGNGQNGVKIGSYTLAAYRNIENTITANIDGKALHGKSFYLLATGQTNYLYERNRAFIDIGLSDYSYPVNVSSDTTGCSCTASAASATPGSTVTIYPVAKTGYTYQGFTLNGVNKSGTTFTMPNGTATVVAKFTKNYYNITRATSPANAGTVTADKTNAGYGDTVTVGQTPAAGYEFIGWSTNPSVTINSQNKFSMPNQAITVTANYRKRSTGTLSKTSFDGGETIKLTISAEKTSYTHKYKLDFSAVVTGMATGWVDVAANTSQVNITVPASWSDLLPNLTKKAGGKLILRTYSGSSQVASDYEITALTFNVPAGVVPTLADPVTEIVRTIGGKTYANVDETISGRIIPHYVQNHCGVRVTATAAGARSSTIANISVTVAGYTGNGYSKTQSGSSLDFSSGLLFIAGQTQITVTATDSRGRTVTKTVTVNVEKYDNPSGSLTVWRVNVGGDADENGAYGEYSLTKDFSRIGINAMTAVLSCSEGSLSNPPDSGDIFPNDRKSFNKTQEYTITLTLTDAFETTVITAKLPSARYIIFVDSTGKKLGIMKATTQTPPEGKTTTFEIAGDCQVYIGNDTLEDYINSIVQAALNAQ